MAKQSVTVTFEGEPVRTLSGEWGTMTLYETPAGLYRVHVDQADGYSWVEPDPYHEGYDAGRARIVAPELFPEHV